MVQEIVISKGAYSIIYHGVNIAENYLNKIVRLPTITTKDNQSTGSGIMKIVDLLRITHQFVIKGYITGTDTKTAKEVKDDLREIVLGASINGGTISMLYDGDTFNGYIENLSFIEVPADGEHSSNKQYARYEMSLTFLEGVTI